MDPIFKQKVGECVGLWLAEGSTTSKSEITFTNNCLELVDLFKKTINEIFKVGKYNQRIYIYSKNGEKVILPYKDCVFKYYIRKRANKPYLIFRVASVSLIKKWNEIVKDYLKKEEYFPSILRGFFAGEGNIHGGKRGVRTLRIAQGIRKNFIENILDNMGINYSFYSLHRYYVINAKSNWDIFAKYSIADLHPIKKEKFWRFYNSYKEEHYSVFYLKNKILELLSRPFSSKELSNIFNRSQARVSEVLVNLKKENKVNNYRVKNIDYWTNNKNLIIISKVKNKYLNLLNEEKTTAELARVIGVDWKSSSRRLNELKELNLVKIEDGKRWQKIATEKQIWVI